MIIIFLSIPIILMILYLIVAYRTMKDIQRTNATDKREKFPCRISSIRKYKNVEDYYITRNNLNYP